MRSFFVHLLKNNNKELLSARPKENSGKEKKWKAKNKIGT